MKIHEQSYRGHPLRETHFYTYGFTERVDGFLSMYAHKANLLDYRTQKRTTKAYGGTLNKATTIFK